MKLDLRTWHREGLFVVSALASSVLLLGRAGDWREWLAALGVQLGFHHASVADRLREAEERRRHRGASCPASDAPVCDCVQAARDESHRVECVVWLQRYWVGKELAWVAYFLATGAVSPLVGCAVFLLHPVWRRYYRARQSRRRARVVAESCSGVGGACQLAAGHTGECAPTKREPFNPYVCRLLRRIDGVLYRLRGWEVVWNDGHVCRRYPSGSMAELPTHFPDWAYRWAAAAQNRWPSTRRILSW